MSFDCYGTLIDWETGILQQLQDWTNHLFPDKKLIQLFGEHERNVEEEFPMVSYPDILTEVHHRIARSLDIPGSEETALKFGQSVGEWPAFPDSSAALKILSREYKLIILSNVDRKSFSGSNQKLGVEFDAIITAEDVGSYKPDPKNFEALINRVAEFDIDPESLLHVGESIYHDVIPATEAGLDTAWIDRRHDDPNAIRASGALDQNVKPTYTFSSMDQLALIAG